MGDNMEKVTCWYCEHYNILYKLFVTNYVDSGLGECTKSRSCCGREDEICESFKLREGLYTLKWYPGKKGKW